MIYLTSSNSRLHLALSFIRSHTAQTFPNDLLYLIEKASPQIYYLCPAKIAKGPKHDVGCPVEAITGEQAGHNPYWNQWETSRDFNGSWFWPAKPNLASDQHNPQP